MTRIKICGIKEVGHALVVGEAGADLIGFVFAPSPRRVSPEKAKEICAEIKVAGFKLRTVGVFVNAPVSEVNRLATDLALDLVQLSGNEDEDYYRRVALPVIKAIRVGGAEKPQTVTGEVSRWSRLEADRKITCLLDSGVKGTYGGTGKVFDWELAREAASVYTIIIAGGLNPDNVAQLVRMVRPWGVDVSSGVESDNRKDGIKIRAFINAVKEADSASSLKEGGIYVSR